MMRNILYIILFFSILPLSIAKAAESWNYIDVICDDDMAAMVKFYQDEELYPIMAGVGNDITRTGDTMQVINVLLQEPEGDFALIRYYPDKACLLAVGGDIVTDAKILNGYLGIE